MTKVNPANKVGDKMKNFSSKKKSLQKRAGNEENYIARALTQFAFRNGPVEDMHANGMLSDEEMKTLNKFMVNRLAYAFHLLLNKEFNKFDCLVNYHNRFYGRGWDWAELDDGGMEEIYRKYKEEFKVR